MGAIRREMHSAKWTAFAIGYQCVFAYAVSLVVYQVGSLFTGEFAANPVFYTIGLIASAVVVAVICFMLFRSAKDEKGNKIRN